MKKSAEYTATVLAVTAALAASSPELASAETAPQPTPKHAAATKLAGKISRELYDTTAFPKGAPIPVPGILNGTVEINAEPVSSVEFDNPIMLIPSHSIAATEKNSKLLDGSWVGIPVSNEDGHVSISPVQINLGHHDRETVSLELADQHNPILEGADVHITSGQLYGSYTHDGDSGKFPIVAHGMK